MASPRFSISTPSRHPANQKGYDAISRRYGADYVNPKFWILNLDASPGLPKGPSGDVEVPSDVISFTWTVNQVDGPFSLKDHRTSSPPWKAEVQIPRPGEYEVSLQVNLTGGRREINTRRYRLRDFLIVGIGDSFAAGQGNPDVPAISSLDEKALCEATTLLLAISKIRDMIRKFATALEKEAKEKIEDYLPFVGKIVVAELGQVEDVVGFVKGAIKDLQNEAVQLVKDVGGAIVEGAEEVLGGFGFGDGGEKKEVKSRPARWQEPNAYRSYRSGHSLAARQIETESDSHADRVTFLSFARTGSEIRDGLLGPRTVDPNLLGTDFSSLKIDGWTGNRGQIQEAKDTVLNRPIDALLITIGVNDLGFSSLVTESILKSGAKNRRDLIKQTEKKIDLNAKPPDGQLPRDFDLLKKAIDTQLRPRQVFITEYPAGLFTKFDENHQVRDSGPCDVLTSTVGGLDLDLQDGAGMRRLGKLMNAVIRAKADKFGWTYVGGIEHGFDGHGYCATPDSQRYFVKAQESCLNQGDFEGMLHPNKKGHEVTRDRIADALKRNLVAPQEDWLEPVLSIMMR